MKESFAVEDEGFDQVEGEEAENLIRDFVAYVKKCKVMPIPSLNVVNIDELAAHFGLKSEDAVNRINCFLDNGMLQGVMDDRGKFICITEEELKAVAKFINQRGRVSIQELADYSNMLIQLDEDI
uniref:DDRGK domain-containing protein 1 n=1 Tax=Heterorhabditis bacteriophora TaxID=37862 RepID=A0A1I7XQ43_HETBA